jgi:hypothetical protein
MSTGAMDEGRHCIRLQGQVISVAALRDHPEQFEHLFIRTRAERTYPTCLCRTDQPERLVMRLRGDRWHLACWPDRGHHHEPDCVWYRVDPTLSGRGPLMGTAITTTESGTSIRLDTPLSLSDAASITAQLDTIATPCSDTSGSSRRSATLLALLHYLWEQAQLSLWLPTGRTRRWHACVDNLATVASECTVNNIELSRALYLVPPYTPATSDANALSWQRFVTELGDHTDGSHERGLLLGELRDVVPTDYGVRIKIAHLRGSLFASRALGEQVTRSYRPAFSPTNLELGARRIVLCVIDRSPRDYVIVEEMAVMLASPAYIPVDSGPELRMADGLVRAGRRFIKPLRYDHTPAVFPDFVLTDTQPWTIVEVWGITGRESYEARKAIKKQHYRENDIPLLEWDVRAPMPELRHH